MSEGLAEARERLAALEAELAQARKERDELANGERAHEDVLDEVARISGQMPSEDTLTAVARIVAERDATLVQWREYKAMKDKDVAEWTAERDAACAQRDEALADNAEWMRLAVAAENRWSALRDWPDDELFHCAMMALRRAIRSTPHPGAALLEELEAVRKERDWARKEQHRHARERDEAAARVVCLERQGAEVTTALLEEHRKEVAELEAQIVGSGENHIKALDYIAKMDEEHRKALVRARNEGLEKAAAAAEAAFDYVKTLQSEEPSLGMPEQIAWRIRAMKEPEE